MSEPSKVIRVRNVGPEIDESDLLQLVQPFGAVTKLVMLRAKNQALLEMHDVASAATALQYFTTLQPNIRGWNVYMQFSSHQELTTINQNSQGSMDQDSQPNRILLVTIHHMLYPITVEVLHQVFSSHGFVEKIVTFQKSAGFQALIQYQSRHSAVQGRNALQGRNVYDGCCQLDIQYSNLNELQVNYNNEMSRDFTNPSLPSEQEARPSQMSSGSDSRDRGSGSGPRRQQMTSLQSPPVLSAPPALPAPPSPIAPAATQGCATASSSSCSVGPSSKPAWGRGSGRRGPTRGPTERRLGPDDIWDVTVIGGTGVGQRGCSLVTTMGVVTKSRCKIWQKDMVKLPQETKDAIFRDLQVTFRWDRTPESDKQMLRHMTKQHRDWRGSLKHRHYANKSLEDAIASVPAGVDPSDWRVMCEKWATADEQKISDRNKVNRSNQTMPYRRGRTSHTQLKHDYHSLHGRDPDRLEIFKMGRCKVLPDGTENWVDKDSMSRYERITQLATPLDSESESAPLPLEEAFISVMGKDRSGRIRCAGSHETLRTWYGPGEGSSSSRYNEKIHDLEETIRVQREELEELRTHVSDLRNQQVDVNELRTQMAEMKAMCAQFGASHGGVQSQGRIPGDDLDDQGSDEHGTNDLDE